MKSAQKKHRGLLFLFFVIFMPVLLLSTCALGEIQSGGQNGDGDLKTIQIAATGGFHNYFLPWDYLSDSVYDGGSLAQTATVIRELRENNPIILIDCGDSVQGNAGDMFAHDPVEPMADGMNFLNYDACAVGVSDISAGPDRLTKIRQSLNAPFIASNMDINQTPLGDECAVIETENGAPRIGVLNLIAPEDYNLNNLNININITDPVESARRVIERYQNQCDIFIAIVHANNNNLISDLAAACPEIAVILSPENHNAICDLSLITLNAEFSENHWNVINIEREEINPRDYDPDSDLSARLEPYDSWAKETVRAAVA